MSELSGFGDFAKPATLLVEKISNAIGRHYDPRQTVRMAEAQAKASRILAVSQANTEIEISELRKRAEYRAANEEMTRQRNIERITGKAAYRLTSEASPGNMDDDWITNLIEKIRNVSVEDMQNLWAGILAGEANNPGSFSRKTVNLVSDLDKGDAELFASLCRFVWFSSRAYPFVFDWNHEIYNQCGITFDSVSLLESLGMLRNGAPGMFLYPYMRNTVLFSYHDKEVKLTFPQNHEFNAGYVEFTRAGQELLRIVEAPPVEGFFEYVYDRWASQSLVPPREPQ